MGDPPRSVTPTSISSYYNALGLPKSASLKDICKAYKSLAMRWHPDRNTSNTAEAESKFASINEAYRVLSLSKKEETISNENPKTPKNIYNSDDDGFIISRPTLISTTSKRIAVPATPRATSRTTSRRSITPTPRSGDMFSSFSINSNGNTATPTPTTPPADVATLAKMMSRRNTSPIIYSHSNPATRKKPPPVEKKLACKLEELCYGGVKTINIQRDVISHFSGIVQEEEELTINIKPGWKKGTRITFEGKGDERPGFLPADLIFIVDEKKHPLFKRKKNDLELGIKVPLVQALTGCTTTVPLLGGEDMIVSIDDIIYPGYEMTIPDEGMPIPTENCSRGDLFLKFLVEFPENLSDEQRSEIVGILEDVS